MPLSTLYVERVVNGARDNRYEETLPEGHVVVLEEGDNHTHVVFGTPEELAEAGVSVKNVIADPAKPKRKPAAKKKSAAKKATARKTTARKR